MSAVPKADSGDFPKSSQELPIFTPQGFVESIKFGQAASLRVTREQLSTDCESSWI